MNHMAEKEEADLETEEVVIAATEEAAAEIEEVVAVEGKMTTGNQSQKVEFKNIQKDLLQLQ